MYLKSKNVKGLSHFFKKKTETVNQFLLILMLDNVFHHQGRLPPIPNLYPEQ